MVHCPIADFGIGLYITDYLDNQQMRVLIAEDESIIRLGLKSMLQELGYEVILAKDGHEALSKARIHHPDLAILDIKMPFTDGLQVAATLARKQPMPILLLTAFSEQDLIEQASDLPIHGYLIKPIQLPDLAAAIAVGRKRFQESQGLEVRANALEETMETRKFVYKAKEKLMSSGMSEQKAFSTIQERARSTRKTMHEVARAILHE